MTDFVPDRHLVLIGLRGAGKTTVGQRLADLLRRPFFDLDDLTLRRLGATSVRAVFAARGEAAWRVGETEAFAAFVDAPLNSAVIAMGGGAPLVPAIRERLLRDRERLCVTLLDCSAAAAATRLSTDPGDRTSLTGLGLLAELEELARVRRPQYIELAHGIVDADRGDADDVAQRVLDRLTFATG